VLRALAAHAAGAALPGGAAAPGGPRDALLTQLRGVAAAVGAPVTIQGSGFDPAALTRLERRAFEGGAYRGVDAPPARRLMLREVGDEMFETVAWTAFRAWAPRAARRGGAGAGAADAGGGADGSDSLDEQGSGEGSGEGGGAGDAPAPVLV
jgi:hypothetical protein